MRPLGVKCLIFLTAEGYITGSQVSGYNYITMLKKKTCGEIISTYYITQKPYCLKTLIKSYFRETKDEFRDCFEPLLRKIY